MRGTVTDSAGEPLPGASVLVTHIPSGSQYGNATNESGSFTIRNMRVGGPYRIRVTFIGYTPFERENIFLELGETYALDVELSEGSAELGEVQVVAAGDIFDRSKTGVGRNVRQQEIEGAPTVGRDLADYTRLTPQAFVGNDDDDGPSISIAGQNNRYNSIFIDGAVSNDVFGLSAQGTNGGQTGTTPISLDAIEQFQINLSPYSVTQGGFTGGAINAITRSGTNQYEGAIYFYNRNEGLAGKTPSAIIDAQGLDESDREQLPPFINNRFGFRLGGPVVKDKLFFFANVELLRSETPQPFVGTYSGQSGINGAENLRQFLINEVNYDPGTFGDKNSQLDDNKLLFKLDWNISRDHKLVARHSYTDAENIDAFRSTNTSLNYAGRNEVFPSTTNSSSLEIRSTFGNNYANKFLLGYTRVRDDRNVNGQFFPTVNIEDGDGDIFLGNEPFSTANILEQDIFTITNDFNIFAGDHTITIGTHNEFYDIANLFIPYNFGWYFYEDRNDNGTGLDEFRDAVRAVNDPGITPPVSFVQRGFSLVGESSNVGDNSDNIGAFKAYQLGVYAENEWQVNPNFRLKGGLRFDVPGLTTSPRFAEDVFETTLPDLEQYYDLNGAEPGEPPSAQLYISPRVGFNWDVFDNEETQVRGGSGLFLGRVPFVWPGGMYLNNGANTGILAEFGNNEFRPNPENGLTLQDYGRSADELIPSGRLEIFEDDFKYPRVWRTSLGVDQQLPFDIVGTLETQFTKNMSNIDITNINLLPTNETLEGPDNRPIRAYEFSENEVIDSNGSLIDGRYQNILRVGNTSKGYSYDISATLRKQFGSSLNTSISYTYGDSYTLNDGTSSQLNSIWSGIENVNGANDLELSRSDFSLGHRLISSINYRKEFLGNLATSLSIFMEASSGRPFSYAIASSDDMIGENGGSTALMYVPNDASELQFTGTPAEQQVKADRLDRYISSSDYLDSQRGDYAERNGSRTPMEFIVDLKIRQELFADVFNRRQSIELTLDFFNVTNLLGELIGTNWGKRSDFGTRRSLVRFEQFQDPEAGDFTPVYDVIIPDGVETEDDYFDQNLQDSSTYSSRWLAQVGVRYSF